MNSYQLFADGASSGNPGPAGIGIIIKDRQGKTLKKTSHSIGKSSNNVAEYLALIIGLLDAERLGIKSLNVYLDSELLIKQIKGIYKVKSEHLKPLLVLVKYLSKNFENIVYNYIERERNKEADKLASKAIQR